MTLPWDELQPEEPVPVPEPPPQPVPVPVPPPNKPTEDLVDRVTTDRLRESFGRVNWDEALEDAWPQIKEQVLGYARDSAKAVISGQTVDILHPTVTAETAAGKELVVADAKSRSWRTLVQGLIVDVIAAIAVVLTTVTDIDPFVKESWVLIGVLVVKSVLSAIISFVMRLKVTPTIKLPEVRMNVMPLPTRIQEEENP